MHQGRGERRYLGPRIAREAVTRFRDPVALDGGPQRVEGVRQVSLDAAARIQVRRARTVGKGERQREGFFEIALRRRDGDGVFGGAGGAILQEEPEGESETKQARPPAGNPCPRTSTRSGWW